MVSNDDGVTAPGIRFLIEVMKTLGEVIVVAPDSPQSGKGHAITISDPLRLNKLDIYNEITAYECSGTPADCVKLAKSYVLKDRTADLVVSGVNHGGNSSISVIYSGTMSAAIEGAVEGIPAIGFSLMDYAYDADFEHIRPYVKKIASEVLQNRLPKGVALNVNFPAVTSKPIKGIKICRQAIAKFVEDFDERKDPQGRPYFWMSGAFQNSDKGEDTDEWALAQNYVSVVPCQFDLTAHHAIPILNSDWDI